MFYLVDVFPGMLVALILAFVFYIGKAHSYIVIRTECDKIGHFYINDKVYECKEKYLIK